MSSESGEATPLVMPPGNALELTQAGLPEQRSPLPERLGRFRLLEELGSGGMSIVFRAEDTLDGSFVAVKVLRPEIADSEEIRRRFVKESRVLSALDTPYVTRLIEADTDGECCYLAMEFVDGESLGHRLRQAGRLGETEALQLIADAARGLAAAHALRIVHRDIKPDNLLVRRSASDGGPRLKVTDFGLGRPVLQEASLVVTAHGALLGTPLYMAPEQFGTGAVDPRADVYALGSTLFHMLAGQPPFPLSSLPALAKAVSGEPPPPLSRLNSAVTAATAKLVARSLSKHPNDRPADAGLFLRSVESILAGESAELAAHPLSPAGRAAEYAHTWELASTRERLWPYVSNTERLNRAVGLPAPQYEYRHDPDLGPRRFAKARVVGFRMEWQEHPFEWVEGRRMGILREYVRGPFKWFLSVLELEPSPAGGTILRHTLRAEPRGLIGRIAGPFELGIKAKRNLGRVYRRIDELLVASQGAAALDDPFEPTQRLSRSAERKLMSGAAGLRAAGADSDAVESLVEHIAHAPAQELSRIRPLVLARRHGIDGTAMAEACLRAVPAGLLELRWDIVCPLCRIPSGQRDTLRDLRDHENCEACGTDFPTDFAQAVELVFRANPEIRVPESGVYCAGGPAHSPHVVAQTRLAPGEQLELELQLTPGHYRLRSPQWSWVLPIHIDAGAVERRGEVALSAASPGPLPPLASDGQTLTLRNACTHEVVVRVERAAAPEGVLSAARAALMPSFRELFPGELLSPGQLAPASTVTFLLVQVFGGDELYERSGEGRAFQLIQSAIRTVEERAKSRGGTVVKTVGEGVLTAFGELTAAIETALSLKRALAADPLATGTSVQAAIHRGLAMVATVNDRLDYFGQTVRTTARLAAAAQADELIVSAAAADDYDAAALFGEHPVQMAEVPREGRPPILVYRVALAST